MRATTGLLPAVSVVCFAGVAAADGARWNKVPLRGTDGTSINGERGIRDPINGTNNFKTNLFEQGQ